MSATVLAGIRLSLGIPLDAVKEALPSMRQAPPHTVRPDLALIPPPRQVLLVSARHDRLSRRLESEGADVTVVKSVASAIRCLAVASVDVLAVDPDLAGAIELVKSLKLPSSQVWSAWTRTLPVFILPLAEDHEYAVIVEAPTLAFLDDEQRLPLADAMLHFDVRRLLRRQTNSRFWH